MIDSFYIGAYWGNRKQTLVQSSEVTLNFLKEIRQIDEHFVRCFELGGSRKQALANGISLDLIEIKRLYSKSIKKGELDEFGFTSFLFSLGIWTGHKNDESSSISFSIGKNSSTSLFSNVVVIRLPIEGFSRDRLLTRSKIQLIFHSLIQNFNPDRIVLVSTKLQTILGTNNEVGWVTWVKRPVSEFFKSGNLIVEGLNGGTIISLNIQNDEIIDYELINRLSVLKP